MARHTKEQALETRERILDAAVDVFYEYGVARPSLTEVAKRAGVTRGAVYGHFENKADLFSALCDRVRLPTEAICEADPANCKSDPLGELREACIFFYQQASQNEQWSRILGVVLHRCEIVAESGMIQQRMDEAHDRALSRLTELLQQAVDAGQLPEDLDVARATPLLHGALFGVLSDWLFKPEAYDLAACAEQHVDALIDMLRLSPQLRRVR